MASNRSYSQSAPWGGQADHLKDLFGRAQQQSNEAPYQAYAGPSRADINPYLQQAFDSLGGGGGGGGGPAAGTGAYNSATNYLTRSLGGGPSFRGGNVPWGSLADAQTSIAGGPATSDQLEQTAAGDYLGSNPYLDQTYDRAAGRLGHNFSQYALPGLNATFGGAGRTGSPAHERAFGNANRQFGQGLADLGAGIYGPAYESERNRQFSAGSQQAGFTDQERARQYDFTNAERGRVFGATQAAEDRRLTGSLSDADRRASSALGLGGLGLQRQQLHQSAANAGAGRSQQAFMNRFMVGRYAQEHADSRAQDEAGRHYFNQAAGHDQLARYQQLLGSPIMQSTSKSSGSTGIPWGRIATGAAGVLAAIPTAGASLGLTGAAIKG